MDLHSVDLARLVAMLAEEVIVQTQGRPPAGPCSCHAVSADCCPTRVQPVIDAGASRLGLNARGGAPRNIASLIDHTLLKPEATRDQIDQLCREAAEFGFATVCVNPTWVPVCAAALRGTRTALALSPAFWESAGTNAF